MENKKKLEKIDFNFIIYVYAKFYLYGKKEIIFFKKENFYLHNETSNK